MSGTNRLSYEQLYTRLKEMEALVASIRHEEVDAIVGEKSVVVLNSARRFEEALLESREQFRMIYDASPMAIALYDPLGNIINVNKSCLDLFGVEEEKDIISSDILSHKRLGEEIIEDIPAGGRVNYQTRINFAEAAERGLVNCRKKGVLYLDVYISPLLLPGEQAVRGYLAKILDITALKAAEEALKQREKQLEMMCQKFIKAQEEERKRLSRELHDSIGQKIISMQLEAVWLKNREPFDSDSDVYTNMLKLTIEASEELQQICMGLRPLVMDRIGFNAAMKSLVEEFENSCDIAIESRIMPVDESRIGPDAAINIYRILQEALTNIVRHSNAQTAYVSLRQEGAEIALEVKDEGCGLAEDVSSGECNFGILGMKERVNMSGGAFYIDSRPGKGTSIRVSIPFRDPA